MSKTTSKELSIALKEAGAKQESEYAYDEDGELRGQPHCFEWPASFDCPELLKGLPERLKYWDVDFRADILSAILMPAPAEALGKLKLWCLQNGHCNE